jgi:hypothetical protein
VSGFGCQVPKQLNPDTSYETSPGGNSENKERRTSNPPPADPILMALRFIYLKQVNHAEDVI